MGKNIVLETLKQELRPQNDNFSPFETCSSCTKLVQSENFCSQCGKLNLSKTETIRIELEESIKGDTYTKQSQSSVSSKIVNKIDKLGQYIEAKLINSNIRINSEETIRSSDVYKGLSYLFIGILAIFNFRLLGNYFNNVGYYQSGLLSYNVFILDFGLIFTAYSLYKGKTSDILLGTIVSTILSLWVGIWKFGLKELMLLILFLILFVKEPVYKKIYESIRNFFDNHVKNAWTVEIESKQENDVEHLSTQSRTQPIHVESKEPTNYNQVVKGYQYRHKGATIANIILFGTPIIASLLLMSYLISWAPVPLVWEMSTFGFTWFMMVTIGNIIYFLPAFLCHSVPGKFLLWIFQLFFSWTIIGWFIGLFISILVNNNRKRQQEVDFLLRRIADK